MMITALAAIIQLFKLQSRILMMEIIFMCEMEYIKGILILLQIILA